MGAIGVLPEDRFKVAFEPEFMRDPTYGVMQDVTRAAERTVFYAGTEPGRYTIDQMVQKLAQEFPRVNPSRIRISVMQGLEANILVLGEDGTISLAENRPQSQPN